MKGIKINLDVFITKNIGVNPLTFTNITNLSNNAIDFDILTLLKPTSTIWVASYSLNGDPSISLNNAQILTLSTTNTFITFDADINDIALFYTYYELGIIELVDENITSLILYKQNDENDVLEKNLTFVGLIQGKFNHSISVKNVNIDYYSFQDNFNYVFIPKLKRYYYVDSIEIISNDYTRLHLKEDVLMSWKDLIKNQTAYVNRNENGSLNIEDSRRTTYLNRQYDVQTINIPVFLPLEQGSVGYDFRYVANFFD